jgi:Ca-activated chloride channel family protein
MQKLYRLPITLILLFLMLPVAAETVSMADVSRGSLLEKNSDGSYREIPLQATEVDIQISGPVARSTLKQTFHNPGQNWMEAIYAFPLPENAAVDHMKLHVGERIIEGQIHEKQQARQIFETAKREGKKTALVEQHRPNLFTTSVANIPPGANIIVELEYQQQLDWRDERFSIQFPMAITPRYTPPGSLPVTERLDMPATALNGWAILPGEIPNVVPLDHSDAAAPQTGPTRISINLDAGFELAELNSRYHAIKSSKDAQGRIQITLQNEITAADRDFVLEWRAKTGQQPKAAFFAENSNGENYGLLMLMPPALNSNQPRISRETQFIIDTSGSMGGESIRQAQQALQLAIERLGTDDTFNIIEFNNSSKAFFPRPLDATAGNRQRAMQYVSSLEAGGGTEMLPALQMALSASGSDGNHLQQVVFITDGAVGNEQELLDFIHKNLGQRRLFTVAIGSAPNHYFMKEAAQFGRGSFEMIADINEVEEKMRELFEKLEKPVLTNLQLQTDSNIQSLPENLPDLYAGEPINIALKQTDKNQAGFGMITLTGQIGQTAWQQQLDLNQGQSSQGLAVHWGREEIKHWMRAGIRGVDRETVRSEVISLALKHHLVSQFTSLVAVDITPSRPLQESLDSKAINGRLPAGSVAGVQPVRLASGASGYPLYLLAGILLLISSLWWRKANAQTTA